MALSQETALFVALNVVGIFIQVGIVYFVVHGLGHGDRLSYNIATIIGIGIGTMFRLFTYRRFVFRTPAAPTSAEQLEPEPSGR